MSELSKTYDPFQVESRLCQFWKDKGYFVPKIDLQKTPFVITMPPPNVTGELHIGHALTMTLEDIMVRWHRMKGDPTLWLPGIDHAGIATQVVVEKQLAREGLSRYDLGREKFVERVWQWVKQYRHIISEQGMKLGASCDWSRECFTLDEGPSRAVRTTFTRLYNKGLIYRGERIINWCPRCHTALSDLEVEHKDTKASLYYIKYPLAEKVGDVDSITVATTRPETMLGDTAVTVNPDDDRYRNLVGNMVILPIVKRHIPIIADEAIDPAFGTGAVKLTPAHSPVDFEIAQRHNLPSITILNEDAIINESVGHFKGLDCISCRSSVIAELEKEGLLVKTEPYSHAIAHCTRCHTLVEPIISKQWFVKTAPLAKPAIQVVLDKKVTILPDHFTKVYLEWMNNIRDWCISRQLWWGHRIPAWYCEDCNHIIVSVETPKVCPACKSTRLFQDPDVLDTWFSSALWPHSTLGWPDDTEDLHYFYPTTVMETAYDILFFWVARMIMMGLENTGEVPFHTVYLHGLARDETGMKMSKSKGNVVNPLGIAGKYGTDALRFSLTTGNSPGIDWRLTTQKLEAGRNFANKLWNAARFVMHNLDTAATPVQYSSHSTHLQDRWIVSRLNRLINNVNQLMMDFQFGEAERQIYEFTWGEFCDWYIEMAKTRLKQEYNISTSPLPTLVQVLETVLRLLHPFMPFITEEIWQTLVTYLPVDDKHPLALIIAPYPVSIESSIDDSAEREMEITSEIVRAIRNARAQLRIEPALWMAALVYSSDNKSILETQSPVIETLARVRPLTVGSQRPGEIEKGKALVLVLKYSEIVLPLDTVIDIAAEKKRLEKEIGETQTNIEYVQKKLNDEQFVTRADPAIVEREREKWPLLQDKITKLREWYTQLS